MCGVMGDGPARKAVAESPRASVSRAAPLTARRSSLGPLADTVIGYLPPRVNPRRDSTQVPVLVRLFTTGLAQPSAGDRLTRVPVTTPVLVIEFVWPRVMVLSPEMGNAEVGVMTVTRAGLTDRVGADPVAEPCLAVPLALKPATIHPTGLPTAPRGNPGRKPRSLLTRQPPWTARSAPIDHMQSSATTPRRCTSASTRASLYCRSPVA